MFEPLTKDKVKTMYANAPGVFGQFNSERKIQPTDNNAAIVIKQLLVIADGAACKEGAILDLYGCLMSDRVTYINGFSLNGAALKRGALICDLGMRSFRDLFVILAALYPKRVNYQESFWTQEGLVMNHTPNAKAKKLLATPTLEVYSITKQEAVLLLDILDPQ